MLDARFLSLPEAASPAVLATYRRDGTALVSPVWFRLQGTALEVVIAEGDIKLKHLARRAVLLDGLGGGGTVPGRADPPPTAVGGRRRE